MTPEMMLAKMLSNAPVMVEKTAAAEEPVLNSDPMEKAAWADAMGRELAREDMEKNAVLAFGAGKLLGGIGSAAKSIAGAAKAAPGAGKGLLQGAKNMGSNAVSSIKAAPGKAADFMKKDWAATKGQFQAGLKGEARPALAKTPVPGVHHNAPAVPPAAPAALPDPRAQGHQVGKALGKAALVGTGALAVGAGGYALANRNKQQPGMERTASVQRLDALMEKMSMEKSALGLPAMGGLVQGAKALGTKALTHGKDLAGAGMHATQLAGAGARAGVGAAGGAALGAAKGMVAPGTDAQGNKRGRLGAMARGATGGAVLGAGAGLASKGIVRAVGSSNTGAGQAVRNTMQGSVNSFRSGNLTAGGQSLANKMQGNVTGMGVAAQKAKAAVPAAVAVPTPG